LLTNLNATQLTSGTVPVARLSGSYTGITGVGTIGTGVWQGTAITDTFVADDLTISSGGSVDWTALTNYPTGCNAGEAVTAVGDTLTCAPFASSSGSNSYIHNDTVLQTSANFNIQSGNTTEVTANFQALTSQTVDVLRVRNSTDTVTVFAVSPAGDVTATSFTGNGSGLTNLNATNITTGTVANARLTNNGELTVTAGTGLTGGGSVALGGSTTLNVAYGSTASTAVEGNTQLTCPSGTGNLNGGGTVITLGTGGTCAALDTVANPTFGTSVTTPLIQNAGLTLSSTGANNLLFQTNGSTRLTIDSTGDLLATGNATLQGGGLTVGIANSQTGSLILANGTSTFTGTLQVASLGQATTYTLPDPGQATADVCLSTGNCAGLGQVVDSLNSLQGDLTLAGTTNQVVVNDNGTDTITLSLPQDIHTGATPTFAGLTLTGNLNLGANTLQGTTAVIDFTNFDVDATGNLSTSGTITSGLINGQTISSTANFTGTVGVATSVTTPLLQSTGALSITPGGALTVGSTTQSLTLQGNGSTVLTATDSGNTTTLSFATPTATRSIVLPDDNGTVCLQASVNCGFVLGDGTDFIQNQNAGQQASSDFWISGTGRADTAIQAPLLDTATAVALNIGTTNATAINLNQDTTLAAAASLTVTSGLTSLTGDTTGDALNVSNSTSTGNVAVFKDNTTAVATIADGGATTFQNSADSTAAFAVLNASSVPLFQIDTTNNRVYVGDPTADATGALLVLDTKNTSGDPTGVAGGMYYNSDAGRFRCFEGVWKDCIFSGPTVVRYTATGTSSFTKATYPWATKIKVMVQAGGAGGGGADSTSSTQLSCGAGGAGGAYAESWLSISALGTSETVTVGAGGTGIAGNSGNSGGSSSFGTLVSAGGSTGGGRIAAGNGNSLGSAGTGGTSMTGDVEIGGGDGHLATRTAETSPSPDVALLCVPGQGGDSHMGHGSKSGSGITGVGVAGDAYGGGGSGARAGFSNLTDLAGGDGADGIVIVEIY
jgi:hypothetical protein